MGALAPEDKLDQNATLDQILLSVLSPMFLPKIEAVILNKVKDLRLPLYAMNF